MLRCVVLAAVALAVQGGTFWDSLWTERSQVRCSGWRHQDECLQQPDCVWCDGINGNESYKGCMDQRFTKMPGCQPGAHRPVIGRRGHKSHHHYHEDDDTTFCRLNAANKNECFGGEDCVLCTSKLLPTVCVKSWTSGYFPSAIYKCAGEEERKERHRHSHARQRHHHSQLAQGSTSSSEVAVGEALLDVASTNSLHASLNAFFEPYLDASLEECLHYSSDRNHCLMQNGCFFCIMIVPPSQSTGTTLCLNQTAADIMPKGLVNCEPSSPEIKSLEDAAGEPANTLHSSHRGSRHKGNSKDTHRSGRDHDCKKQGCDHKSIDHQIRAQGHKEQARGHKDPAQRHKDQTHDHKDQAHDHKDWGRHPKDRKHDHKDRAPEHKDPASDHKGKTHDDKGRDHQRSGRHHERRNQDHGKKHKRHHHKHHKGNEPEQLTTCNDAKTQDQCSRVISVCAWCVGPSVICMPDIAARYMPEDVFKCSVVSDGSGKPLEQADGALSAEEAYSYAFYPAAFDDQSDGQWEGQSDGQWEGQSDGQWEGQSDDPWDGQSGGQSGGQSDDGRKLEDAFAYQLMEGGSDDTYASYDGDNSVILWMVDAAAVGNDLGGSVYDDERVVRHKRGKKHRGKGGKGEDGGDDVHTIIDCNEAKTKAECSKVQAVCAWCAGPRTACMPIMASRYLPRDVFSCKTVSDGKKLEEAAVLTTDVHWTKVVDVTQASDLGIQDTEYLNAVGNRAVDEEAAESSAKQAYISLVDELGVNEAAASLSRGVGPLKSEGQDTCDGAKTENKCARMKAESTCYWCTGPQIFCVAEEEARYIPRRDFKCRKARKDKKGAFDQGNGATASGTADVGVGAV